MTERICDYLGVKPEVLDGTGAFNGFLDEDTKLFIDPRLLKKTAAPELKESYQRIRDRFSKVITLLSLSQTTGDYFWRRADNILDFPEVRGLCIGYCSGSTDGSGIGEELRAEMLTTAKIIIDAGHEHPELFEVMGLFEKDIGADRICDMIANIIMPDLLAYSSQIFNDIGVCSSIPRVRADMGYVLPQNPHSRAPIILVPKDVLNHLPLAHSYQDIGRVVAFNQDLRKELNQIIGDVWSKRRTPKWVYKRAILNNPEFFERFIRFYQNSSPDAYDLALDPLGLRNWFDQAMQVVRDYPIQLALPTNPTAEDVVKLVLRICNHFKRLVENNGLHKLLYQDRACTIPKHEEAAQALFFGIADGYCQANNLDISPETNSGRGHVDLKISKGYNIRVLTEMKLSSNKRLVHGFTTQLEEYKKAEQTQHSIFVIVDVGGCSDERWAELENVISYADFENQRVPTVVYVDGKKKPPASKL